ncbi:hypothetical protein MMC13_006051 [Lambiella insularis]|nr:hypothetical protein [Lambiella insularis]
MPLHLLGKKSWNVYNTANIQQVKKDEAAAAAQEAVEEQRMQEVDAERRIQLLRGLPVAPSTEGPGDIKSQVQRSRHGSGSTREGKRRRIEGENDTERDIRYAKECQDQSRTENHNQLKRQKTSNAPLVDRAGHINLFPVEGSRRHGPKNPEAESEAAAKKKEYEDQYTMRFSNAAGFKKAIDKKPWYHNPSSSKLEDEELPSEDVWGNDDPRRKLRQKLRIIADDPLAMIHKGVQDLRQVEMQKREWKDEQEQQIRALERIERRKSRKENAILNGTEGTNFVMENIDMGIAVKIGIKTGSENEYEVRREIISKGKEKKGILRLDGRLVPVEDTAASLQKRAAEQRADQEVVQGKNRKGELMLTVGGVSEHQSLTSGCDWEEKGVAIFDMSALTWGSFFYDSSKSVYTVPNEVVRTIGGTVNGSANATQPVEGSSSDSLASIYNATAESPIVLFNTTTNSSTVAPPSSSSSMPTTPDPSRASCSSEHNSALKSADIVGVVIDSMTGVGLIMGAIWLVLRRPLRSLIEWNWKPCLYRSRRLGKYMS